MSDGCYFCGEGTNVLETHHIVPQRHDGSDGTENLVDLCPTCHERLERLYNKRFYDALGVEKQTTQAQKRCEFCTGFADGQIQVTVRPLSYKFACEECAEERNRELRLPFGAQ